MAKKRDIIIGVIIAAVFIISFGFMGLMFVGLLSGDSDFEFASFGGDVGIVEIFGVIDETTGRKAIKQIDRWAESKSIKAIVLHINSPGGGSAISHELYEAIKRARDEKPIVASFASVAASGGYYIACAADRIISNPSCVTGSIGVIFQFHTYTDLMDKIGIGTETIKSGLLKDVGSYSRDMTQKEELMLKSVVMDTYEQFVEVVAEGRNMEVENIYPLADGSIYTGQQALNLGLVDSLGGLYDAINVAADLAGIEGEPKIVKHYERKRVTIFDLMGNITKIFEISLENKISGPQLMFLYQ